MQEPYFSLHMEAIGKSPCSVIVIFVIIFRVSQQLQGRKCWLEHFIPAAAQNSISLHLQTWKGLRQFSQMFSAEFPVEVRTARIKKS